MKTTKAFDKATLMLLEQDFKRTVEIFVQVKADTPIANLLNLTEAPGIHTSEDALSGATLSDDKTVAAFPLEVRVYELENFCKWIPANISGFTGFSFREGFDQFEENKKMGVAVNTVVRAFNPLA